MVPALKQLSVLASPQNFIYSLISYDLEPGGESCWDGRERSILKATKIQWSFWGPDDQCLME